uniref:Uncharacterized protein n=1 Tax=Arundo donax TaxID=35708 RepID=A0A0A9DJT5_ARUDO
MHRDFCCLFPNVNLTSHLQ